MAQEAIHVQARSAARPETVFAIVEDGARWPGCTPLGTFARETPGAGPEGVGDIRIFRTGGVKVREQVVEVSRPTHLAYVMLSGLPMRDYRAEVDLEPDGTGTIVHWRATFAPKIPGTGRFFRSYMTRFLQRTAAGIAAAAH
jgi:carbon monoxide dehydrogenase subunit G